MPYRQFEILDVAWDSTLGSEDLDMLLMDHFSKEFATQNPGNDPLSSPKVSHVAPSLEVSPKNTLTHFFVPAVASPWKLLQLEMRCSVKVQCASIKQYSSSIQIHKQKKSGAMI